MLITTHLSTEASSKDSEYSHSRHSLTDCLKKSISLSPYVEVLTYF